MGERATRSGVIAVAALGLSWSCGGKDVVVVPPPTDAVAQPATLDQAFEDLGELTLSGVRFVPGALGAPPPPLVSNRRKVSLTRLRKRVAGRHSQLEVQLLVTALWELAQKTEDEAAKKALLTEALVAARSEYDTRGVKAEPVLVEQLAALELAAGDETKAAVIYRRLVKTKPDAQPLRSWLAYLELRQGALAAAAELVPTAELESLTVVGAYVRAWTHFSLGQCDRAVAAIERTASIWHGVLSRGIRRDVALIMARCAVDPSRALAAVASSKTDDKHKRRWLRMIARAYRFAGRYDQASKVLDEIANGATAERLVTVRSSQARQQFRLGAPDQAAKYAAMALAAAAECSACDADKVDGAVVSMANLAASLHTIYSTSLDERYHAAAAAIYRALKRPELGHIKELSAIDGHVKNLGDTHRNAKKHNGRHVGDILLAVVKTRSEVLVSCYERELARDPRLAGSVTLSLEITSDGTVNGASTEPAAGEDGLAAVGSCLVERTKAWKFPSRTVPGRTYLKVTSAFRPEP